MNRITPRLAVLDDEVQMRKALSRLLRSHGFDVETFSCGDHLMSSMIVEAPDCLVLDLHMPDMSGFDVLKAFDSLNIKVPVIVITGHDEPHNSARVLALGASAYLTKPLDESCLLAAISAAITPAPGQPAGNSH